MALILDANENFHFSLSPSSYQKNYARLEVVGAKRMLSNPYTESCLDSVARLLWDST